MVRNKLLMNSSAFSYLSLINFSHLYNWSVQYAQRKYTLNNDLYDLVPINEFLTRVKEPVTVEDNLNYKRVSIRLYNAGIGLRDIEKGINIGTKKQFRVHTGQFLLSKIDARNGAFGVVPEICDNAIITGNFWTFDVNYEKVNPYFLTLVMTSDFFIKLSEQCSNGTTNRHYLQENLFLDMKIPLPPLEKQKEIVDRYNAKIKLAEEQEKEAQNLEQEIESYLFKTLDINIINFDTNTNNNFSFIQTINFKNLKAWSFEKNLKDRFEYTARYKLYNLDNLCIKITDGTHQTPKYVNKEGIPFLSAKDVTTQKINWENIKYIPTELHSTLCKRVRPQLNDILLAKNGTTGVAAIVDKNIEFSIYVSLALLRVNNRIIRPNYLLFMINSKIAKMQFNKKLIGIGVPNLHLSEIKTTKIPIPPLEIQDKIICKINEIKAKIENLNNLAEQNRQLAQEEFEKELFE